MDTTEFDGMPGILIPCESVEALTALVKELYDKGILTDESIKLVNVPEDIKDILNEHV
ncbi:MAG: hypothetical protein PHG06_00480 [Parabacteroides sp.]|nr:hypothetical protein [Parabacteroides sp.]